MAVRSGMANLLLRLRTFTETSATEYTVNSIQYWTDQQLQDLLDGHRTDIEWVEPTPLYEYSGGTTVWKDYDIGYHDLEEQPSLAPYWSLVDSTQTEVTSSLYAVDYRAGRIRFTADTGGVVYFLKARSYNLFAAAAEVWQAKLAHVASAYDFRAEDQEFSRSQLHDHYVLMLSQFKGASGFGIVPLVRNDLR